LRDWAEALLDDKRLAAQGLLNVATVRRSWRDHLDDDGAGEDRCWPLWNVICLQTWLDHQTPAPTLHARPRVVEVETQQG
jgi:asparagine synthase (glutamine-hydrolysing)